MSKYISFGSWTSNYKYLFITSIFLALFNFFNGIWYDSNSDYSINLFPTGKFSAHFLIHQMYLYFVCFLAACIIIILENILDFQNKKEKRESSTLIEPSSLNTYINLIGTKLGRKKFSILYKALLAFIIFSTEQFLLINSMFFGFIYFWIFELYFIALLYLKIFKIDIYRHQYLAFTINIISIILNIIKILLTIAEKDVKKAIYVKYWWLIFIAIILYLIYSISISYALFCLKHIFNLDFIPVSHFVLIYGFIGTIACAILSTIFTFNSCGKKTYNSFEIRDYICKIIDNNNQTYFENFNIYFSETWKICEESEIRNEIIACIFKYISFSIHKYYEMKTVDSLTPFHRIFSSAVYYCSEIIFILIFNFNKIIKDDNKYLKAKIALDCFACAICLIAVLIYLEIIEINFCNLNYNLRKNIIIRGINNDSENLEIDINSSFNEEEKNNDENDNNTVELSEIYN